MATLRLPDVLDALPLPVCIADASLRIAYVHPRFDLRLPPGNGAVGAPLLDHLPPDEATVWREVAARAARPAPTTDAAPGSHAATCDMTRATEAGVERWRLTATKIPAAGRGQPHTLFTCRQLVTRQDADRVQQDHDAVRLDVVRQLAVTLNHEVNNPLFIVSATIEDALADTQDADMERRLRAALDAVWRVSSAVKQLSEIRQLVSTVYIEGYPMIDLEASQESPPESA